MNKSFFILIFSAVFIISCEKPLTMEDLINSYGDSGNSGHSGNSGDTGDSGNTGNNFPHEHDGLKWSDASNSSRTWDKAVTYCKNMGGRLPTISELRTLIQNCPATQTGGSCGVTDSCLSSDCWNDCGGCEYDESGKYSVFGDADWFWSSSEWSGNADAAWHVNFRLGDVDGDYKDINVNVRCVR